MEDMQKVQVHNKRELRGKMGRILIRDIYKSDGMNEIRTLEQSRLLGLLGAMGIFVN